MYEDILASTAHRHYPLPMEPWLMTQRWDHLLFLHLPVSKDLIDAYLPEGLELDSYKGTAWISIVPFQISNMHLRKLPPLPYLHSFLELNVRTYVKRDGRPGIYFFRMDADKLPAVLGARTAALPYYYARMKMGKRNDAVYFTSARIGPSKAEFKGTYRPVSETYYPDKASLSEWLLERYCLWTDRGDSLYRVDIHHKRWEVQDVEATVAHRNLLSGFPEGLVIGEPVFHYVYSKRVLFWPIRKVK